MTEQISIRRSGYASKITRFLAVAIAMVTMLSVSAQTSITAPIKISAAVDSATLNMAQRTILRVEILKNSHDGASPEINDLLAAMGKYRAMSGTERMHSDFPAIGKMEIRQIDADSTDLGNGRMQVNYDIDIQAFEPGSFVLPQFRYYENGDSATSEAVAIKVLEPDMPQEMLDSLWINPMRPPVSIKSRWYDWIPESWPWWLAGLGVLALAVLIITLYSKNGKTLLPVRKKTPPHIVARKRLAELQRRHLAESGNYKAYYTELSEIMRQYLGARFGIFALEMTSAQILEAMSNNDETRTYVERFAPVFEVSDFVKFAKQTPTPDQNTRAFKAVEDFVNETAPRPEQESKGQGKKTAKDNK